MNATDNAMMNATNNAISNAISIDNAKDRNVEYKRHCFKTPYDFDVNNDCNKKDNWEDEIYND